MGESARERETINRGAYRTRDAMIQDAPPASEKFTAQQADAQTVSPGQHADAYDKAAAEKAHPTEKG